LTEHDRDDLLRETFANANVELAGDSFTADVMSQADRLKRRLIIRRILVGLVFSLIAIPLEDFVLAFSQFLLMSLVELEDSLAAQLLAPVNSVAGLLSFFLLALRIAHKRLFS